MVNGGVTPLVDAADAHRMGYKLVIWPIFALMSAFNAYDAAARELRKTGFLRDQRDETGVRGGVREVFELCGLSDFVRFDEEMGGQAYRDGV